MLPVDALVLMMANSGMTMVQLAAKIGRSKNYITSTVTTSRKRSGSIATETMLKVADACGYKLAYVKHGEVPEDAIVLTLNDD